MCYLHAEGYSGGALKHGPFALIEDKNGKFGATPIILLIFDDEHAHHMRTAAEEVRLFTYCYAIPLYLVIAFFVLTRLTQYIL